MSNVIVQSKGIPSDATHRSRGRFRDWRSASLAVVAIVALLCLSPPLGASCFDTRLPESGLGDTGDDITTLTAVKEDLVVSVAWNPDPDLPHGRLRLLAGDQSVGLWDVARAPGTVETHTLTGALESVPTHGFQYRLVLEDDTGPRDEKAFHVTVACPDGVCHYQVTPNLVAGHLLASEALWAAIAEAREAGATDLVNAVRSAHPELESEIVGFLWRLGQSEPIPMTGCSCRWVDVASIVPSNDTSFGGPVGVGTQHTYGANAAGAGFTVGMQARAGNLTMSPSQTFGWTVVGMHLLCTLDTPSEAKTYGTQWPSLPMIEVPSRQMAPCPAPCTPQIETYARVTGCAEAKAVSRQGAAVSADARVQAQLLIDNVSHVDNESTVRLDTGPGQIGRDESTFFEHAWNTAHALGSTAMISNSGALDVTIGSSQGSPYPYGFAAMSSEYQILIRAEEACTGVPFHMTELFYDLDALNQGGGVAMEQWEDP